jgi:hypothetical protein
MCSIISLILRDSLEQLVFNEELITRKLVLPDESDTHAYVGSCEEDGIDVDR